MKLIRFILFPFSLVYQFITSFRNFLFNKGWLKSTSFSIPVIAVGNLNVGGTGKTPQIEYLVRLLKDTYNLAILSRGYKRKTSGFQLLNNKHTTEDVGDEPMQFFKKFQGVSVAVDTNRTHGINQLQRLCQSLNVILLDDAFQHRKVKAGLYILLTKYKDLYVDDFVLPTGNLREWRSGAKRAQVIIITKCPIDLSSTEKDKILKKINPKANQQVFFSGIDYDDELKGASTLMLDSLVNKKVVLVTGIANPNPLTTFLKEKNIVFTHIKFPDHHHFTNQDILKIKRELVKSKSEDTVLLTTEKDYVRLHDKVSNLHYITIKSVFLDNEIAFNETIVNFVESKI